jgi:hypothetical protein
MVQGEHTSKEEIIKDISKNLEKGELAIFAGAGLSSAAGHVDWKQLLYEPANELGLQSDKESDLVALAQYYCNEAPDNRARLENLIIDLFSKPVEITENHRILSRLPIKTYWTTNYDQLIETSLKDVMKHPDVKYRIEHLTHSSPDSEAVVYKMHGDVECPGTAILTKDDYEKYAQNSRPFVTALSNDLVSKTFLFIGFSFSDPNLEYILSQIRIAYPPDKNKRFHYCFMRQPSLERDESTEDFEYRKRKFRLFTKELERSNMRTIIVDKYEEITILLREVEKSYKRKNIFISGSAAKYNWPSDEVEEKIHNFSRQIIKKGYRIISGFGLGVGSPVVSGALEEIYCVPSASSSLSEGKQGVKLASIEQLILRPFPQNEHGKPNWLAYRKDMISRAGIAIFLFGNKKEGDTIIDADGVRKEFEIAKAEGIYLFPIGRTGYMSKQLWDEMKQNCDISQWDIEQGKKEKLITYFEALDDELLTLEAVFDKMLEILDLLTS